jgi:hypothetical protein
MCPAAEWGVCCSIDQAVHLKDLVILARHRNELESEIEDGGASDPRLARAAIGTHPATWGGND